MAEYLQESGIRPGTVLCSSALRARQTLEGISAALPARAEVVVEEGLYTADAHRLLHRVQQLDTTIDEVMVIGHNPTLHDLALQLATEGDQLALGRLREKLPTGALVTLVTDGRAWADLVPGAAALTRFVVPRDLTE